jgi:hypothetical protein
MTSLQVDSVLSSIKREGTYTKLGVLSSYPLVQLDLENRQYYDLHSVLISGRIYVSLVSNVQ